MRDDLRSDIDELRLQVRELARENQELRALLGGGAIDRYDGDLLDPISGPHQAFGERLRARRRRKGRLIAFALLALGLGTGFWAARYSAPAVARRIDPAIATHPGHAGHPGPVGIEGIRTGPRMVEVAPPTPPAPPTPAPPPVPPAP